MRSCGLVAHGCDAMAVPPTYSARLPNIDERCPGAAVLNKVVPSPDYYFCIQARFLLMTKPVFRADHCGSLIRPAKLRKARVDRLHGQIDDAALEAIEDEAILDVLKMQRNAGIQIYSDGEFRRAFWLSAISDKFFHGFEDRGIDYSRYPTLVGKSIADREEFVPQVPVVVDKLKAEGRITGDEIKFLKRHSPGTFKMTLPSPVMLSDAVSGGNQRSRLSGVEGFFDDFTRLMADEVKAIVDDGVTYVQIDAPGYSRFIVPKHRRIR